MKKVALVLLALMACKSSKSSDDPPAAPASAAKTAEPVKPAPPAVACDPAAAAFAKRIETANGYNLDRSAPETKAKIDEAAKDFAGTRVAFTNCAFTSQGNDTVSFAAVKGSEPDIDCIMVGGEEGNRKFRDAAMSLSMEKLRLDVVGTVALRGDKFELTECTITPHE